MVDKMKSLFKTKDIIKVIIKINLIKVDIIKEMEVTIKIKDMMVIIKVIRL